MRINIKNSFGETIEFECESSFLLKSLTEKYKNLMKEKGNNIKDINFAFNGEILDEDNMYSTIKDLGIEDGGQIIATIPYIGGKI